MRGSRFFAASLALGLHPWLGSAQVTAGPLCPSGMTEVDIQPVEIIIEQAYQISGYFSANTILTLPDGLQYTISDAPVAINTVVVETETSRSLKTSQVAVAQIIIVKTPAL